MNAVTPTASAAPMQPIDFEKYTGRYVALRDLIKSKEDAFKKEIAPAKELLERLNNMLLHHLNTIGVDSVASASGTVYRKELVSVTMPDAGAFREYVISNQNFDLADIRPSKGAIEDFVKAHGALPPGVNFSISYDVGVRRKTSGKGGGAVPSTEATGA
jgi:hypothetical protein